MSVVLLALLMIYVHSTGIMLFLEDVCRKYLALREDLDA
jgi:hypothetical protein